MLPSYSETCRMHPVGFLMADGPLRSPGIVLNWSSLQNMSVVCYQGPEREQSVTTAFVGHSGPDLSGARGKAGGLVQHLLDFLGTSGLCCSKDPPSCGCFGVVGR